MTDKMVRVLHLFPEMGTGGTEKVIIQISQFLKEHENYEIALGTTDGVRKQDFVDAGVKLYNLKHFWNKRKLISNLFAIRKVINDYKPTVVHTHTLYSLILVFVLKKLSGNKVKLIHTGHGGPRKNYDKIAKRISWMTNKYIALSSETYKLLAKLNKRQNIYLIENGVEQPPECEVVIERDLKKDPFTLAFIGRLTEQKGIPVLIQAIDLLTKKGYETKLLIIGDGETKQMLKQNVIDLSLEGKVHFLGFQSNPWILLKDIPIIVMPSLWEQGALVVLEALVRNHTLVATNINGINHVIKHEKNGYLFEPDNVQELANILIKFINYEIPLINLNEEEKKKYYFKESTGPKIKKMYEETTKIW
jgi:Glycosyltransferase